MYNALIIAQFATLACLLEASAEKPGNVTPTHAFRDMAYEDFLHSAVAIGPEMGRAGERGVGETVLAAVQATQRRAKANTNLGIVLLFAPLAKAGHKAQGTRDKENDNTPLVSTSGENELRTLAPALRARASAGVTHHALRPSALRDELHHVLHSLTIVDAVNAYTAIRLALPGGLEARVEKHDVRDEPTVTLLEAMAEASGRDSLAAEYVSDYAITFERGLPALEGALAQGLAGRAAVVQTYLELLAAMPDTLIARKKGQTTAAQVSQGAASALRAGGMHSGAGRQAVAEFDATLRGAGNALNPGTTADLTAATLFAALLTGMDV